MNMNLDDILNDVAKNNRIHKDENPPAIANDYSKWYEKNDTVITNRKKAILVVNVVSAIVAPITLPLVLLNLVTLDES